MVDSVYLRGGIVTKLITPRPHDAGDEVKARMTCVNGSWGIKSSSNYFWVARLYKGDYKILRYRSWLYSSCVACLAALPVASKCRRLYGPSSGTTLVQLQILTTRFRSFLPPWPPHNASTSSITRGLAVLEHRIRLGWLGWGAEGKKPTLLRILNECITRMIEAPVVQSGEVLQLETTPSLVYVLQFSLRHRNARMTLVPPALQ